jgi:hypothetical protein
MADEQTTVIAFRIPTKAAEVLHAKAESNCIVNVRSGNQFARKIVLDFLSGKLIYVRPKDKFHDPALDC